MLNNQKFVVAENGYMGESRIHAKFIALPFYLQRNCYLIKTVIESRQFYEAPKSLLPLFSRLAETRYRTLPTRHRPRWNLEVYTSTPPSSSLFSTHLFITNFYSWNTFPVPPLQKRSTIEKEKMKKEQLCLFLFPHPCHTFFSWGAYEKSIMLLFSGSHNADL